MKRNTFSFIDYRYSFIINLALLTLMFFQSTRQFIASIYYENLTGMGFSFTVFYIVAFFSPLLLLLLKNTNVNMIMTFSASSIVIHRIYGALHSEAGLYVLFHTIVIVSYGIYLPVFLFIFFALNDKYEKIIVPEYPDAVPGAVAAAPAIAVLLDIMFQALGDTLDATVAGATVSSGDIVFPGIAMVIILGVIVLYMLRINYKVVEKEMAGLTSTGESPSKVSFTVSVIPGITFGFLLLLFFTFLGYPDLVIRWTHGDYVISVFSGALFLLILIIALQITRSRSFIFKPSVQILLNLIQYVVILDVLLLDAHIAQYLIGVALCSMILNMFIIFYAVAKASYAVGHLISLFVIGILVFLLLFFVSVFCLLWAHIGPLGLFFKDKNIPILLMVSTLYILFSLFYFWKTFMRKPLTEKR